MRRRELRFRQELRGKSSCKIPQLISWFWRW
uniref:Uncharacterized protein n=1 Tax=Arundo donax TaxID=35708 RepID=A0A0A8YDT5_ARUDO